MILSAVVKRPIITEKSMREAAANKFSFEVTLTANKKEIKNAIEKMFSVHVVSVATVTVKGRSKRIGKRRAEKKLGAVKKAIIELKKGEKIAIFEEGQQEEKK